MRRCFRFDDVIDAQDVSRRLAAFCSEDEGRSARAFWATVVPLAACFAAALTVESWLIRLPLILLLACLYARAFSLHHDAAHGAYLRRQPRKRAFLSFLSNAMLSPPAMWKEGHTEHHRRQGIYDAGIAGEYPVWTVDCWREAGLVRRSLYRISRAPATIVAGYFTIFLCMSCVAPLLVSPRRNRPCLIALLTHFGTAAIVILLAGWGAALTAIFLPMILAAALGAYLIYAQHNAPGLVYADEHERNALHSAVRSTTFFRMNRAMRWITANIGFHNIHHAAPKIPFYRLPAAYAALPEWSSILVQTSWSWMDVRAAFAANLYDPRRQRMVTFAEASRRASATPAATFFAKNSGYGALLRKGRRTS